MFSFLDDLLLLLAWVHSKFNSNISTNRWTIENSRRLSFYKYSSVTNCLYWWSNINRTNSSFDFIEFQSKSWFILFHS